jgi:hypothetical protein
MGARGSLSQAVASGLGAIGRTQRQVVSLLTVDGRIEEMFDER